MLERDNFTLFDEDDFYNIIGEHLTDKLQDRGIDNYATYFITYSSILIQSHIREYTGLNLYKEYSEDAPNDYELHLALSRKVKDDSVEYLYECKLTSDQIEMIKLACVYQADYIIDNGSTERMTSMGLINRSNKYNKYDMHEFEICSVSHNLLANAGLLYQGLGGGVYAKLK